MKITTWNVNSIRARLTHVQDFLREHRPDVLCLQETKVQDEQFPRELLEDEGYNVEVFGQKSYNGVAILSQERLEDVFRGLPDEFEAGRYHSLAATRVPEELDVSATTADGEVMAVRHRELWVDGVQFHPESVLTPLGPTLAKNFLEAAA